MLDQLCLFTPVISFVPEWSNGEFVSFIGYILVDKNTSYSGH